MNEVALSAADGWKEWLNEFEWDMYHTLTFKDSTAPEQAEKEFRRYVRSINEVVYGKRYRKRGECISWARALEYQKRGVIHFHCVTNGTKGLRYADARRLWERVSGNTGRSWIEGCGNSQAKILRYITKYMTKGGDVDAFLSPKDRNDGAVDLQTVLDV